MESLFTITTAHGGPYFSLFYTIAFLLAIAIFIIAGFKSKYPKLLWLLISLSGALFFITGNKLFACTPDEWLLIFTKLQFPETTGKTILGGITGLIFGLFLASRLLNFRKPVIDKLAIALPIAMAIQRVGCLLGGCCFGTPTNLPWSIKYGPGFMAYNAHLDNGHIHFSDQLSLAVHPTQLYQIIGCLLIAFIVWRMRKYWKASGNLFLFSVLLYIGFRFFIEFLYDPIANSEAGVMVWGLKYVQWALAIGILLIGITIFVRDKGAGRVNSDNNSINVSLYRAAFLIIFIILTFSVFLLWFDAIEKLIICLLLVPTVILLSINVFKYLTIPKLRWITALLFIGCFILTSQNRTTYHSRLNKRAINNPKIKVTTFQEIAISSTIGMYHNYVRDIFMETRTGSGCGGPYTYQVPVLGVPKLREHRFTSGGIEFFHNRLAERLINKDKLKIGFAVYLGNDHERSVTSLDTIPVSDSYSTFSFNPRFQYDVELIGIRVGMHIGKLRYADLVNTDYYNGNQIHNIKTINIYPDIGLRVGPYHLFYFTWQMSSGTLSNSPVMRYRYGIGTGLGKFYDSSIEIGIANDNCFYLNAIAKINERCLIEAVLASDFVPKDKSYIGNINDDNNRVNSRNLFSLGFRYRFNFKEKPLKTKNR